MSKFKSFALKGKAGNVDRPLPQGGWLDTGSHAVKIVNVEQGEDNNFGAPTIVFTFEDENDSRFVERRFPLLFIRGEDEMWHSQLYKSLANAILPADKAARFEFFLDYEGVLANNPDLWESLIGCQVVIDLRRSKTGYTIEKDESGKFYLHDLETDAPCSLIGGTENEFEGVKEAREAAKASGLRRAYLNLADIQPVEDDDVVEANQEAVKKLLVDEAL